MRAAWLWSGVFCLASACAARGQPDTSALDRNIRIASACEHQKADEYTLSDIRTDEAAKLAFDACAHLRRRGFMDFAASGNLNFSLGKIERIVEAHRRAVVPQLVDYILARRKALMAKPPQQRPTTKPKEQAL